MRSIFHWMNRSMRYLRSCPCCSLVLRACDRWRSSVLQPQPPQQPHAAGNEFVPISQLPPQDQLPAAPLLISAYVFVWLASVRVSRLGRAAPAKRAARGRAARVRHQARHTRLMPTAAHFIYIPGVLLIGIVIGWILGSRAAADAYASELRKRGANPKSQAPNPKSQN